MPVTDLVNGVLNGKRRELARLISLIEDEDSVATEVLSKLYKHTGKAHIIGVTGPPGSGKSSLVTKLTTEFRKKKNTIGIVCVDPSSPFTGGALLGDYLCTLNQRLYITTRVIPRRIINLRWVLEFFEEDSCISSKTWSGWP